jgi:replicative DNA helicase Mcm
MPISLTKESIISIWEDFLKSSYQPEIEELFYAYPTQRSLVVDYKIIEKHSLELADLLLSEPVDVLDAGCTAVRNLGEETEENETKIHLRVRNLPEVNRIGIRDLRSEHLGNFLAVEGLIKKITEVRPKLSEAVFECKGCGNELTIVEEEELLTAPNECPKEEGGCGRNLGFKLLVEKSKFIDQEKAEIQEYPESMRGGEQPQRLILFMEDDLVGQLTPGDRVIVNGVFSGRQKRRGTLKLTEYDKILLANSIEHQEVAYEEVQISSEDEKSIIELSKDPSIYEKLRDSVAPTIWGLKREKDALVLQFFGGVPKLMRDGTRIRGDIHILLVGDPSTAKSQLLKYVSNLTPRSIFVSGKSSTAAGLTAAAVRDDIGEGRWTLEAGALVLADQGIACIDELDKISPEDRSALHQAMEQQEISIAKAGINTTLKTRCSLLGAANPKWGRFDEITPLPDQIDMPQTLLSRFDLIFPLIDKPNVEEDTKLAEHILRVHELGEMDKAKRSREEEALKELLPSIPPDLMKKYIAWSKRNTFPVLTEKAKEKLGQYFVDLRGAATESIPLTARQLEALVRLAEASARARLSNDVEEEDALRAIAIMQDFLKKVGIDRETGVIDIDIIATGVPKSQQTLLQKLLSIIEDVAKRSENNMALKEDIIREAELQHNISGKRAEESLLRLKNEGFIYSPKQGFFVVVGK